MALNVCRHVCMYFELDLYREELLKSQASTKCLAEIY
jgi:hypothetical protein